MFLRVTPQKMMDLLLKEGPVPEEAWLDQTDLLKAKNPQEAAQILAEALLEALQSLA